MTVDESTASDGASIEALRQARAAAMVATDWLRASHFALLITEHADCTAQDHRIASGVLCQSGQAGTALPHAIRACQDEPDNAEYALHAGCVSNQCGDHVGAVSLLLQAMRHNPGIAETYQQLSLAAEKLGNLDYAARLALRAYQQEPTSLQRGVVVAHLLSRSHRYDEAIAFIRQVIEAAGAAPFVYRNLAYYLEQTRDHAGALDAIDRAIELDPSNAEYHGYRAFMLIELNRREEADAALQRALELDPQNLASRRHAISILVEKGDIERALRYGGDLIARSPTHAEFANCMRFLLDVQSMGIAASDHSEIAALKRAAPPRRPARPRTFSDGVEVQCRTIMALVLRDIRSRYGESRISFFWVLMEPFLHIAILAVVFQFTMHGSPPMGNNFFLFYFTGVMPYLLLSHLIMHLSSAVRGYRHLMQIPSITPIDLLISKAIVEAFVTSIVFILFLFFFQVFGVDAIPVAPQNVLLAFLITWMLGTGIGLVCAALSEFGAGAETIMSIVLRVLYFASGIFYVPGKLPLFARDILTWNPFLHVVDFMRVGFFKSYNPAWLDISYAASVSVFAMLAGLIAIASQRRRMRAIA